ncbi:MAG: gliding motility-associated C-terminal domain-containing protein [Chitinophagales bacterium]|nr:gliding motility-associated C-terminal domain-containing protein [Chitinophagales bacterium]
MKKLYLVFFAAIVAFFSNAQCVTNSVPNQTIVDCGDSVVITLSGFADFALNNDFNTGVPGTDWTATSSAQFNNPYIPSLTNDTYLWMGPQADVPRELTSLPLDLTYGGQICFDLVYAVQSQPSPVEGPDEPDEGVSLQYSIDGGTTWVDIAYFQPNGDILPANPGPAGVGNASGQTPFTQWGTYCFPIPAGAQTATTQVQWSQIFSSTAQFDHWGLDNIQIFVSDPAYGFFDGAGNFIAGNTSVVYPTADSTYTYLYSNAIDDSCYSAVSVTVNPTDAGPDIFVSCDGIGFNMNVTGVAPWATVTWSPIDGLADINDPNTFALPFQDTEYTVTSACGTDDILVLVEESFTINMDQPDTICLNGSTFLSLTTSPASVGISSVTWNNVQTLEDSVGNTVLASPLITTQYIATVTSDSGCVIQDSVVVNVQGVASAIGVNPANPRVCQGSPIDLEAVILAPSAPYTLNQTPFSPYPTTGGTVIGGFTDDNTQGPLPLGFNFPFFGTPYNQIWLSSNGWFTFSPPTGSFLGNATIPTAAVPNNFIAWAWDDLNFNTSGTFSYYNGGSSPNQYIVLNFLNVAHFGSTTTVSVQVVLYENGLIEINNLNVVPDNATGTMTQGIENATGTIGVANAAFNNTNMTSIGESWSFVPYAPPVNPVFTWSPPTYLNTTSGPNVTSTPNQGIEYFVTMEDGFCTSVTSVEVVVDSLSFDSLTNDLTLSCPEDSLQFFAEASTTVLLPEVDSIYQIGFGTGSTGTGTPYEGFWEDGRTQTIYLASELSAIGLSAGASLESIAFNVIDKGSTAPYNNFRIAIKHTTLNTLTAFDLAGFSPVFGPAVVTTALGWNTHVFDVPFVWDGVSNLLVETCFDNTAWTSDDDVQFTTTVGNLVAYDNTDGAAGCAINTPAFTSSRMNTRFGTTYVAPGVAPVSYLWYSLPAYSFNDDTLQNPILLDSLSHFTEVFVQVTDGTCSRTGVLSVQFNGGYTLTNDTVVCEGDNLQLEATGGLSYLWTPNNGLLNDVTISNPIAGPLVSPAMVYVDIELSNCTVTDSVSIAVNPLPQASINNASSLIEACFGDTVVLASDADPTWTYTWTGPENGSGSSISVSASGTYTMNFVDANGCSNTASIVFDNFPVPVATINNQSNESFRCPLSSIVLTSDADPSWTYVWSGPESGNGASITVNTDGLYTLDFLDLNSCPGSATILVSSVDTILLNTDLVRNILCCNGDEVSFTLDSLITNGLTIAEAYWDGSTNSSLDPISIASGDDGIYSLRLVDANGCESNASFEFETRCLDPIIDEIDSVVIGQEVSYTVSSSINPDSETWYPSENFVGNVYTGSAPGNSYEDVFVELAALYTLNSGENLTCVETDSSIIFVISVSDPEMPNAFTPNGDALNARFFPVNMDVNSSIAAFRVYNRWGDVVYEYNDDLGWDGTWQGQDQPTDVYTYYLVIDKSSENLVLSGSVTLIR